MGIRAIDLFAGAGGLSHGLTKAGIEVKLGIDLDPACAFPYQSNHSADFMLADVASVPLKELTSYLRGGEHTLVAGCAPCQPFSTYSQGRKNYKSSKWRLLNAFSGIVESVKPTFVTMENVSSLRNQSVFQRFVRRLRDLKFHVWYGEVDCRQYGIAQTRRRLVLLASQMGAIEILPPTHPDQDQWRTVRDTIGTLPALEAGQASRSDLLHRCSKLSDLNLRRMQASRPGGSWKDWPRELRAKCHTRETGNRFISVYGRMRWDSPSPTITTQCFGFGSGRFGHPQQDRAISLREAALLQSFPKTYRFVEQEEFFMGEVGRLIGNAVPPRLGEIIGKSLVAHASR
jgi:DNA (cytosine-5)-methyltransferase 1